jgi:O-antigen ligase
MTATTDRLGVWCGWVLTGAAVLTPLLAWLGPLGFAPLIGLVGLLCLPAFRVREEDWPLAILLALGIAWAALSTFWSPFRPKHPQDSTAIKLAAEAVLYWAAWHGARRVDAAGRSRTLRILAWGLAAYGVVLVIEGLTGGALYQGLRNAVHDPIRPDLGRKNLAQGSFVLALLWPVAAAGGRRGGAPAWLALPMAAGTGLLAQLFLSDAPVLAVGLAVLVGVLVWVWPRSAPKALGIAAAASMLVTPLLVAAVWASGKGRHLPVSWAERMGYWTYAVDRIHEHPWRGWGLDASRTFGPAIGLHPHDASLQLWLELGLLGAVIAALIWIFAFRRLAREARSLTTAATAGAMAVYLFFGAVSFGVWQEWWLALGALVAVIAALADDQAAPLSG